MSRRSHHPARRHGRPHGEPRAPRPAGAVDAPQGEPAGAPVVEDAAEIRAQDPRTPALPPDPPVPARPAAAEARVDETPSIGQSLPDHPAAELGAAEPVSAEPVAADPVAAERSMVVAAAPGLPVRSPAVQPGPAAQPGPTAQRGPAAAGRPVPPAPAPNGNGEAERNACTAPQLRRFIKSRAYVPMHELRRRFGIEGEDDEVTAVDMGSGAHVYVGLPEREGLLLGELLKARDVGYELSLDPISPIVVGVFPMRPIPRS